VYNGHELASGSMRIHLPALQRGDLPGARDRRGGGEEKFGFLLEALRFGTPPHAGFAFGFDRMVMLLAGAKSLRDVIAFPEDHGGARPLRGCAPTVDERADLHIRIRGREHPAGGPRRHDGHGMRMARCLIRSLAVQHRLSAEGADPLLLSGVNDANLQELGRLWAARGAARRPPAPLRRHPRGRAGAARRPAHDRAGPGRHDVRPTTSPASCMPPRPPLAGRRHPSLDTGRDHGAGAGRRSSPPSRGAARAYLEAIEQNDIVVGIGPAGTGKTYLAVAMAVDALFRKRVKRIILARPAVEAGENLGFLPGDLQEKVDPYLRPLYDALEDMMPRRPGPEGDRERAPSRSPRSPTCAGAPSRTPS
jgi:hypothetical protein